MTSKPRNKDKNMTKRKKKDEHVLYLGYTEFTFFQIKGRRFNVTLVKPPPPPPTRILTALHV